MAEESSAAVGTAGEVETEVRHGEEFADVLGWLFLVGNRLIVAAVMLLVVLVVFFGINAIWGFETPEETSSLFYLFGGLIAGNFTLITIVISISQLVISRQLGSPGELRDEIQATNAYREAVEESIDIEVTPVTPAEFLHLLLRSTGQSLRSIQRATDSVANRDARRDLEDAIEDILTHVEEIDELLRRSDVGIFPALAAALNTNYSKEIFLLRKLRIEHEHVYPESVVECLDDLVVRLQQIDVSRQYLKTLYIQDELAKLSRHLLYVGVPALLASSLYLRMFATQSFPDVRLLSLLPIGVVVSIAPLAVLFAYVLRLSIVAQRTLAITPFTTASQERV